MVDITDGFAPGDDDQVVSILSKWKGGTLSDKLFTVLAKIIPQPFVETIILRKIDGDIEILLVSRPQQDKVWPGMIHSPGQGLRAMDFNRSDKMPLNGVFERIQEKEIKNRFVGKPEYVGLAQYSTKRGPEDVHIYLAQISENAILPEGAMWASVEKISKMENFIMHQLPIIKIALKKFNSKTL